MVEKEYEIFIVPNKFNQLYSDYSKNLRTILKLNEEMQSAKGMEEIRDVESKMREANPAKILTDKYELIKAVFIANDYEFDREWMETKADPESLNEFITECVYKDAPDDAKKKEVLSRLGI